MLDVFLPFLADTKVMPIFVVDTKIIFRYDFVASLNVLTFFYLLYKLEHYLSYISPLSRRFPFIIFGDIVKLCYVIYSLLKVDSEK